MLYVYPDNFIVPVIFVENFINKNTSEKVSNSLNEKNLNDKIEKIMKNAGDDQQEKFRDNDKEKYYDELQEELIMDWQQDGEYSLEIEYKNILDDDDEYYVYSETERI